ncbi:MAG: DNA repair protein RecN [candidate division WOR-3 bacterium]
MLKFLRVKNFALMEELALNFEPGLTVITGETGAGKSMIVEAIAALCGEKLDEISIRTGKDYAEITGVFETTADVQELLKKYNLPLEEEIIIRRRVERGKRQYAYINDQLVSLTRLREITLFLVDLVGQHENQFLFQPHYHLKLLDRFAHTDDLLAQYQRVFTAHKNCQNELKEMERVQLEKEEKLAQLRFEIEELEKADLKLDEEEILIEEKNLLQTGEKRASLVDVVIPKLYEGESSAYEILAVVKKYLDELSNLDPRPKIKELPTIIENILNNMEEVYRQLIHYRDHIDFSRERFEEVMSRLDLIDRLKKKYRRDLKGILEYLYTAREEISKLEKVDVELEKLRENLQSLTRELTELAQALSKKRKDGARTLEKEIVKILFRLGMEKARFQVKFTPKPFGEDGIDEVEFYISTNPGEDLKPLNKVGSGGEISRITLSLKTLLSEADRIPIIIFDEVDVGIGGRVAEAVGELLSNLSQTHQVICVTHLPQISIFADNHILVQKEIKKDTTQVKVSKLDEETRKMEIARMLGGKEITKKTIEHAEEILQRRRKGG